jgi:hypothetical protein
LFRFVSVNPRSDARLAAAFGNRLLSFRSDSPQQCALRLGALFSIGTPSNPELPAGPTHQERMVWLAEFVLRVVSAPQTVHDWANVSTTVGLEAMSQIPVLARAARYLVLVIDFLNSGRSPTALYRGWDW